MVNARQAKSAREKAAAMQAEMARKEARRRTLFISLAVMAAIAVVVAAGVIIRLAQDENAAAQGGDQVPSNFVRSGEDGPWGFTVGQADAPVTLVAYEDFQCPACKSFEELNAEQIDGWIADGTVKVEYRPISILDRASPDEYATRAMNAAAAVVDTKPEAFPAYHKALYENQTQEGSPGLTDDKLVELAVAAGAVEAEVRPLIEDRAFGQWVADQTEAATADGVQGTPTLRVNGETLENFAPETVKAAVEKATAGS